MSEENEDAFGRFLDALKTGSDAAFLAAVVTGLASHFSVAGEAVASLCAFIVVTFWCYRKGPRP